MNKVQSSIVRCVTLVLLFLTISPTRIWAGEEENVGEGYLQEFREELDFSELDELMSEEIFDGQREPIRFTDVLDTFLLEGEAQWDMTLVVSWVRDALFYEMDTNRKILLEVVALAVAYSVLKNFSTAFKHAYIAEVSFFLIYGVFSLLLLQSFSVYSGVVEETLSNCVDFMKALVPTFCISMVFSTGAGSSAGFYQIAFLVIYLIQWLFLKILMPMIRGYVLLELFHHFFEDEKFENLTELLKGSINWGLKSAGLLVVGLNVVQGLIAPARDRLMSTSLQKAAAMIPGVGNVVDGVGELMLGAGILIKNCVGAAALVFLLIIGILPMIKILCISLLYKLAAVSVEPVSDKRMAGCLKGMAEGGVLYLKLMVYCLALFMVTIALTTAASGIAA